MFRIARLSVCLAFATTIATIGVAISPLDVAGPTPTVAAQSDGNGLEESSTTTYRIDPESGTVRVSIEIFLRNVTSDQRVGNVIRQTYFDRYGVVLPAGAENIVATRNGSTLSGESLTEEPDDAFFVYTFDIGRNLFNGQSATIVVSYDHTGQPPRSELLWRANAAYASFLAYGPGDSGSVSIQIVLPDGYEIDDFTDLTDFDESAPDEFGAITYSRSELTEDFGLVVSVSNDDLLTETPLDVPGAELVLRSWPDDPEWVAFATDKVESGVPELAELIGAPWPLDTSFDIRQTVEPNFLGYAGWFDSRASEIAVGEELDATTMYHELSHAWFNGDTFDSRWIIEGLAELYAAEMVERDGDPRPDIDTPPTSGNGRQPLSEWNDFSDDDDSESFGYNTSHFVMNEIADEIGFDAFADVLEAVREGQIAYPASGPVGSDTARLGGDDGVGTDAELESAGSTIVDWRRMLDYFEFIGGSTVVDDVLIEYVISPSDLDELDRRSAAIEQYNGLADIAGSWPIPIGIRERMDIWAFTRIEALVEEATAVVELRSDLADLGTEIGVQADATVLDDAAAAFADTDDDFTDAVDLLETEIALGATLVERQAALADKSTLAGATPPALSAISEVENFESALPVADDQIDALDAVIAAVDDADASRSFVENVGLWGTDVDADLDAARAAVSAGDNELARQHAADAVRTLEEADDIGTSRLTMAVLAALGLLLLVAIGLFVRRRRNAATAVAAHDDAAHDDAAHDDAAHDDAHGRSHSETTGDTASDTDAPPLGDFGTATESGERSGSGFVGGEFGDGDVDLDEDALAGAGLSGVDDIGDVAGADPGEAPGAARIIERGPVLGNVGDPVLELHEDVRTVIDTDPVTGAEVLVDPDSHDEDEP